MTANWWECLCRGPPQFTDWRPSSCWSWRPVCRQIHRWLEAGDLAEMGAVTVVEGALQI